MLVFLRCGLGWQFFQEGVSKIQQPRPFSAGFLGNARGPWADWFQGRVWDSDGLARLDRSATRDRWKDYVARAQQHFRFDEKQGTAADHIYQRYVSQLEGFFGDFQVEIEEYRLQLERLQRDTQRADSDSLVWREVASLNRQIQKRRSELAGTVRPWLSVIDGLWLGLERDINALGEGRESVSQDNVRHLALRRLDRSWFDSLTIDRVIPWFDLTVGAFLILGLLTRIASLAAAGFLASVVVSQWPPATGPMSTYYHLNLMLALLVVAAAGAGRIAGLDFFLSGCRSVNRKVIDEQFDT